MALSVDRTLSGFKPSLEVSARMVAESFVTGASSLISDAKQARLLVLFSRATENLAIREACLAVGATIVQCSYETDEINPSELNEEVESVLASCTGEVPLPQEIMKAGDCVDAKRSPLFPQIQRVKSIALAILGECDGVVLPGGISILPKFYGEKLEATEETHGYSSDPRRTIFEFALMEACLKERTPLLGVCRGHQSLHVYFGGKLDRISVGEVQQDRLRTLVADPTTQSTMLGELPPSASFYHQQTVVRAGSGLLSVARVQAVKDIAEEVSKLSRERELMKSFVEEGDPFGQLPAFEAMFRRKEANIEVALNFLETREVVIASESREAPMMSVQYHPEYIKIEHGGAELVKANQLVFVRLVEMAKAYREEKKLIKA